MRKIIAVLVVSIMLFSCDNQDRKGFLGSAVVESRTFAVSTTAQGSIVAQYADEGMLVKRDDLLVRIDTVPLILARLEASAGMRELESVVAAKAAEVKSLASEVAGVEREYSRIDGLVKKGSAPEQKRDNIGTQLQSLQLRLVAARRMKNSLVEKRKGIEARIASIDDKIRRCNVKSPASGVVLTRYRNVGEVVGPGNPLFEIGTFDTLYADFFAPQPLLGSIRLGQSVRIRVDLEDKGGERFFPGIVSWIGNEAEFSPKNIQTRQSRNELVFRIRVTVPNVDGVLKRGLPVEVWR